MILDGQSIVDKHIVTFTSDYPYDEEEQIQPNGIDLRLAKVTCVEGKAILPREGKMLYKDLRGTNVPFIGGYAPLAKGSQYLVDFHEYISVPDGFCAIMIPRSSLLRAGIYITSALWDTGFSGQLGGSLRPLNNIDIEFGARLAQIVIIKSEFNGKRYDGRWQGASSQAHEMV